MHCVLPLVHAVVSIHIHTYLAGTAFLDPPLDDAFVNQLASEQRAVAVSGCTDEAYDQQDESVVTLSEKKCAVRRRPFERS